MLRIRMHTFYIICIVGYSHSLHLVAPFYIQANIVSIYSKYVQNVQIPALGYIHNCRFRNISVKLCQQTVC